MNAVFLGGPEHGRGKTEGEHMQNLKPHVPFSSLSLNTLWDWSDPPWEGVSTWQARGWSPSAWQFPGQGWGDTSTSVLHSRLFGYRGVRGLGSHI